MEREARRREFELLGAKVYLEQIIEDYPELATGTRRLSLHEATGFAGSSLVAKARLVAKAVRTRNRYEESFKDAAVARLSAGEFVPDVARSCKIRESVLRNWAKMRNVIPPVMSWDERVRRMQGGRGNLMLPAPTVPGVKAPKVPKVTFGAQKLSIRIGLNTLAAMPDDKPIHYSDVAKALKTNIKNAHWYLRVRRDAGHVKLVTKGKGLYVKTTKGRKYQAETLPPS